MNEGVVPKDGDEGNRLNVVNHIGGGETTWPETAMAILKSKLVRFLHVLILVPAESTVKAVTGERFLDVSLAIVRREGCVTLALH